MNSAYTQSATYREGATQGKSLMSTFASFSLTSCCTVAGPAGYTFCCFLLFFF